MFTQESEKRLAMLFVQIAECEKAVEKSRADLCKNPNFDVYGAFRLIDTETHGKISLDNIRGFVSRRNGALSKLHVELLISQYDSNLDLMLSLKEFQSLVLPSEDILLRQEVLSRPTFPPSLYIESLLARHFELEANWQSHLQTFKRNLFIRHDFSAIDAFRIVDYSKETFLGIWELKRFISQFDAISYLDCERIIRRLDCDDDAKISYEEFVSGILPINKKTPAAKCYKKIPKRRCQTRATTRKFISSPQKSMPLTAYSKKDLSNTMTSNLYTKALRDDLKEIIEVFSIQIALDKDLETAQVKLAKHLDFNMPDLIKMFDGQGKKSILYTDIENVLKELQIPYHIDEVYLLIKHYTNHPDKVLSYFEFQNLFLPKHGFYNKSIIGRKASMCKERFRAFSANTLEDVICLLKLLLRSENYAESLRRKIAQKPWINLYNVFQDIDKDKDGVLSPFDLQEIFDDYNLKCDLEDIKSFIERYSKNSHSLISYSDFIQELTPKLFDT